MYRLYLSVNRRIWKRFHGLLMAYGMHLNAVVRRHVERGQNHSTFFLRNRAELDLLRLLVNRTPSGSPLKLAVLACSQGAEVYSFVWSIRAARPDLKLLTTAVDISPDVVEIAKRGVYPRYGEVVKMPHGEMVSDIFERVTDAEMTELFDIGEDHARVKPWLKQDIQWLSGDVSAPDLVEKLGLQDIVVANRFMCHMQPAMAERCLRNLSRLVKPGGYLFVSGMDVDVRTKVALEKRWTPVTYLMREIHDGDAASLTDAWPLEYWGLEPFCRDRADWQVRYASVFRIGEDVSAPISPLQDNDVRQPEKLSI